MVVKEILEKINKSRLYIFFLLNLKMVFFIVSFLELISAVLVNELFCCH